MICEDYKDLLRMLAIPTVSLGYTTARIFAPDELEAAQVGYSIDPSGISLIDESSGGWRTSWIVIGYEDGSGDPIFIDSEADGFPVYTSAHGFGTWEPRLIATGLRSFAIAMHDMGKIAKGRENPVELKASPIKPNERDHLIDQIQKENAGVDTTFWEAWLICE